MEVRFVKAGAVDTAKHGLKCDEDLPSAWVFAFLIHYIDNPPVQKAETLSEMSQRHYSLKTDWRLSPAEPSAAHDTPWRLPSLLVGSDPLRLTPAPSPVPFTGAACPFMLKIALSRKGSVIYSQGNTDVFVMLSVVLGVSGVCFSGEAAVSRKCPRFWIGLICSLLLLTSCSAPRKDQPALQSHVASFWG